LRVSERSEQARQSKVKVSALYNPALFIISTVKQVSFYYPIFSWIASQARNDELQ
jgi:hypothetical protein